MAPLAQAAPAVDQYSEGIPTAGGQKSDHDAVRDRGTATIPPATQAQLQKTKKGAAAAILARATAPNRSKPGGAGGDNGLGFLLPVILIATLLGALAIFLTRRRLGASPG